MTLKNLPKNLPQQLLFIVVSLFFLGIFLNGCSTSQNSLEEERAEMLSTQGAADPTIDETYQISPGDEIELLVWDRPNFNTTTTVSGQGTITIPLVGEVQVSGLTKEELRRELESELSEFIRGDMNLTISIRNMQSRIISVFGMVNEPDNYPVVNQTSIFRVLSTAGGPLEAANLRNVKVYRGNANVNNSVTLDLTNYMQSGRMDSQDLRVYPGDIIYVPSEENAIRELSDFLRDVIIFFGIFRVFN